MHMLGLQTFGQPKINANTKYLYLQQQMLEQLDHQKSHTMPFIVRCQVVI